MAIDGQIRTSPITGRKELIKELKIAISSGGGTETINLDDDFNNTLATPPNANKPGSMLVVAPPGATSAATYSATHTPGVSATIVVTVASETNLDNTTIPVILVAHDTTEA